MTATSLESPEAMFPDLFNRLYMEKDGQIFTFRKGTIIAPLRVVLFMVLALLCFCSTHGLLPTKNETLP